MAAADIGDDFLADLEELGGSSSDEGDGGEERAAPGAAGEFRPRPRCAGGSWTPAHAPSEGFHGMNQPLWARGRTGPSLTPFMSVSLLAPGGAGDGATPGAAAAAAGGGAAAGSSDGVQRGGTGRPGAATGAMDLSSALAKAAASHGGMPPPPAAGAAAGGPRSAALKEGGLAAVAHLRQSDRFKRHMELLRALEERERTTGVKMSADELQDVIVESNKLVADLGEETAAVQKFAAELFGAKFPELERIVTQPLDYIRVVLRIGNRAELSGVQLDDLLPPAQVMSVSMASATATLPVLPEDELRACHEACEEVLALHDARREILSFLEMRMAAVAPNTTAILGSAVTAQLVGLAGGLVELAKIPACNLQVLGQEKKKNLAGFSTAAAVPHAGLVYYSKLVQSAPLALRKKACRVASAKVALAVRMDRIGQNPDGIAGQRWRDEIAAKIEKWQEPPPGKTKRPLPVPDEAPKKRRGGKRFRREKERMAMTEMRKDANRLAFGQEDGEYGDSVMGRTLGVLGRGESGRLRVKKKETKKAAMRLKRVGVGGGSGATSGFASSLAFTPVQGLELPDMAAQRRKVAEANSKFFGTSSTFSRVGAGSGGATKK